MSRKLFRFSASLSLIGTAAFVLAACSDSSGPAAPVEVEVPGTVFDRIGAPGVATIPFSIINHGPDPVFISRCGSRIVTAVERWNGSTWVSYASDICQAIYMMVPLELAPGSSVAATRLVSESGTYRLKIGTADGPGSLSNWSIGSRHFDVR